MTSVQIPEALQIDALLTGRIWNIVQRFCGGAWGELPGKWTVGFGEILNEAKRRGLESFVAARPNAEGFWLVESETGYTVFYLERGIRMYREEFDKLEPAFILWLDQTLRSHLLPGRPES